MRSLLLAAALGLILAGSAPGLFAEPAWSWSTSLDTIVGTGDTRYLMERTGDVYSSELIFPLNTLLEGITFRGERTGGPDGRREWGFEASLAVNLLAPFGKMTDSDWFMDPVYPKAAFSYTESDMTMFWLVAKAAWKPVLSAGGWGQLAAVLGYRLQYVSQEANGYIGWDYEDPDLDGLYELRGISYPGLALTYWVLWNVATVGMSVTLTPRPSVSLRAEAGLAVAYVADEDDHVRRYLLSTAAGLGFGGFAELSVRYNWGKSESRVRPFLSLALDAMAVKANTLQISAYYSGATEHPPGYTYPPSDHQISTRQLAVVVACGVTY
jgi:hypothetical protein